MTDINEAIARWHIGFLYFCHECGEEWKDPPVPTQRKNLSGRMAIVPGSHWRGDEMCPGPVNNVTPDYTESLDAQLPVWEALREQGFIITAGLGPYKRGVGYVEPVEDIALEQQLCRHYAKTPAEASANAIHAALVALGEVQDA